MFASFCSLWGLSARCASFCSLWGGVLYSSASSVFVSFFWSRQLNGLGLTASSSLAGWCLGIPTVCWGQTVDRFWRAGAVPAWARTTSPHFGTHAGTTTTKTTTYSRKRV